MWRGTAAVDWRRCIAVMSSVLWLREIGNLFAGWVVHPFGQVLDAPSAGSNRVRTIAAPQLL